MGRATLWLWVLSAALAFGCDDGGSPAATPDPDGAMVDGGPPADMAPQADQAVPDMAPPPTPCAFPDECPGGDCIAGQCEFQVPARCLGNDASACGANEICGGFDNEYYCATECELAETCPTRPRPCSGNPDCPIRMSCHGGRCINSCTTDADCPAGGYCLQGECRRFPAELGGGEPAVGLPAGEGIHVGVAVRPMDYPLGVSAAGFGGREGPLNPYAFALGGSDSVHDRQDVRAVVIADADDTLVLLRIPLCWSTDYMLTLITEKVRQRTVTDGRPDGLDISGRLITLATHSHSHPGRFWNMVPETGFGAFGYGLFSPEMIDRYTTSFAETVVAALQGLQPGRVGWAVVDDFDPERRIHSDRRGESPELVDDRLTLLRVDDREGRPLAAVVGLAIHGTHMSRTWLTGDVAAGIEQVMTDRLSAQAERPVPVLFANGNAADVSPRGDDVSDVDHAKLQVVGHRVWAVARDAFAAIETAADMPLEVATRRVPVSYELLGYDASVPDFRSRQGEPQIYGAFQCVPDSREQDEPPYEDGALRCRINLATFLGAPVVQLHKTVLSAFRVGQLIVSTLPGEPTSGLGLALSALVEADARAAGWADARAVQFGYSQDHHLYFMLPDDWFRGGYEPSQGVWGWQLGPFLVEQARQTAALLLTAEREDTTSPILPTWWPDLLDDTVTPTPSPDAGRILADVGDAPRGAIQTLQWTGGHPGADQPRAWLEQQVDGAWVPGTRPGTPLPFDDTGFESLTSYLGDYEGDHTWRVRWELPFALPLGAWRIVVEGHTAGADGARQPYRVESAAFQVSAATLEARDVAVAGGTLAFKLNYPDGPFAADEGGPYRLTPAGHWLRLDGDRALRSVPGPLRKLAFVLGPPLPLDAEVQVQVDDGAPGAVVAQDDQVERSLLFARNGDGGEDRPAGAWFSSRVELPAPAPGDHQITARDPWGNAVTFPVAVPE
ncbi:MAG: neutral/alkaline non-lysosomal ceramidase N-terminal domain-containing protein [Myxococcales bacterium]|nr:neutral/alkaline non-lysosomal ceramidase N-terminal domain-containing protein [Myxococcales bacterium]